MPFVNQSQAAPKVKLIAPDPYGYVFLLAEVETKSVPTEMDRIEASSTAPEGESRSHRRAELQRTTRPLRAAVSKLELVRAVSLFEAILFAPGSLDRFEARGAGGHPARYDSLLVVETTSPAAAESLLSDATFIELASSVRAGADSLRIFPASNVKKIAQVDRTQHGVFLFNFFFANDTEALLNIWEHTASWWFR